MENKPRVNFVSFGFLIGFGIGSFVGVALALLAIALVQGSDASDPERAVGVPTLRPRAPNVTPTADARPRSKGALDVRLGPGNAYAVVGVMSRGEAVEIVGRNADSTWVSIRFPPGSSGRGWLAVTDLEGLPDLERLAVTLPTPLPQRVITPSESRFSFGAGTGIDDGDDTGTPIEGTSTVGSSGLTATPRGPSPTPTATPRPGPVDLVITGMSRLPDGRVSVSITNRGPGDVAGGVVVGVGDETRSESLTTEPRLIMLAGTSVTLQTVTFKVSPDRAVSALIDPFESLSDPLRANNTLTSDLSPEATPTPGGQ